MKVDNITEGEEQPEPEPEFVPPDSCPVLIVAASPGEFIDKLSKFLMKEKRATKAKH